MIVKRVLECSPLESTLLRNFALLRTSSFQSFFKLLLPFSLALVLTSCCLCPDPKDKEDQSKHTLSPVELNSLSGLYQSLNKSERPKFECIQDVKTKKKLFFGYMLNLVREHNLNILSARDTLSALQKKHTSFEATNKTIKNATSDETATLDGSDTPEIFTQDEKDWLTQLAKMHRVTPSLQDDAFFDQLFMAVDIIPASMALAQAANESAWGTSRFAVQANNLFGQWCFKPGCGVVPQQRPEGATYEVKLFSTPSEAVGQYMLNINRNRSYQKVRNIRHSYRSQQQVISGNSLAGGLENYSARGEAYIEELRSMISYNKLKQWDVAENEYPDISQLKAPDC